MSNDKKKVRSLVIEKHRIHLIKVKNKHQKKAQELKMNIDEPLQYQPEDKPRS
ncbi:hypothetical protein P3TCK_05306 [Photobacterium profundum 3TCK]|uniref:Uncharacterized protein n=1 Tax=Photobacterium profundum 3TCK TaxID=314280 RepID=Q1Z9S4_9GAMM|nr:hypothetical protein P3TCK_05306 [Photobacterium profundum 3TCK]